MSSLYRAYSLAQEKVAFIKRNRLFEPIFLVIFRSEDTRDFAKKYDTRPKVIGALQPIYLKPELCFSFGANPYIERGDIWA